MARLKVTWKRSTIGFARDQKDTIKALGFRRLNETLIKDDTPSIRGMIDKVKHLVEISDEA